MKPATGRWSRPTAGPSASAIASPTASSTPATAVRFACTILSTTVSWRSISPTCGGGLRERSLFDVGDRFRQLMGCPRDTLVLVRPDDHIAAIAAMGAARAQDLYRQVVGQRQAGADR